jgi:hypothetical protein
MTDQSFLGIEVREVKSSMADSSNLKPLKICPTSPLPPAGTYSLGSTEPGEFARCYAMLHRVTFPGTGPSSPVKHFAFFANGKPGGGMPEV